MSYIQPVIIAVIQHEDKYLLTCRKEIDRDDEGFDGYWQLPGGGMEFGEDPQDSLKREIKEELGIEITNIRLIPHIYTETRRQWQGVFLCYLCNMKDISAPIVLNQEASEFGWFTFEEIKQLKTLPKTVEIIKCARERT